MRRKDLNNIIEMDTDYTLEGKTTARRYLEDIFICHPRFWKWFNLIVVANMMIFSLIGLLAVFKAICE